MTNYVISLNIKTAMSVESKDVKEAQLTIESELDKLLGASYYEYEITLVEEEPNQ